MAGVTGLEPAASGVTGQRSNQLSYTPTMPNTLIRLCFSECRKNLSRLYFPRHIPLFTIVSRAVTWQKSRILERLLSTPFPSPKRYQNSSIPMETWSLSGSAEPKLFYLTTGPDCKASIRHFPPSRLHTASSRLSRWRSIPWNTTSASKW